MDVEVLILDVECLLGVDDVLRSQRRVRGATKQCQTRSNEVKVLKC